MTKKERLSPLFIFSRLSYTTSWQNATLSLLPFLFLLSVPFFSLLPHTSLFLLLSLLLLLLLGWLFPSFPSPSLPRAALLFWGVLWAGGLSSFLLWQDLFAFMPALAFCAFFLPYLLPLSQKGFVFAYGGIGALVGALASLSFLLGKAPKEWVDLRLQGEFFGRSAVLFGNPNILAAFLLPSLVFNLYFFLTATHKKAKLFFLVCFLGSGGGLAASFSRGGWVAALLSVLLFLCLLQKSLFPLVLSLCIAPALLFSLPSPFLARVLSIFSGDSSVFYRVSLWQSLASLPPSFFFWGCGEGKSALAHFVFPYLKAGLERVEHLHSVFWHMGVANGIGGLLLFLLLSGKALLSPLPQEQRGLSLALRASLLSLLLFGLFDDFLYATQTGVMFFWLLGVNFSLQSLRSS